MVFTSQYQDPCLLLFELLWRSYREIELTDAINTIEYDLGLLTNFLSNFTNYSKNWSILKIKGFRPTYTLLFNHIMKRTPLDYLSEHLIFVHWIGSRVYVAWGLVLMCSNDSAMVEWPVSRIFCLGFRGTDSQWCLWLEGV